MVAPYPLLFLAFIPLMWLAVTTVLGLVSGWFSLMRRYPDRDEDPLLQLRWQSGSMGIGANMRGLLDIAVCPSGLRIGIMRIFGLFCRDFFVPWDEIEVTRKNVFFMQTAQLQFGSPPIGKLTLLADVADRLARAAAGHWPEPGPLPQKSNGETLASEVKFWLAATAFAGAFFILVPRIVGGPDAPFPPIAVAIGFPAVVLGIMGIIRYFTRTKQ